MSIVIIRCDCGHDSVPDGGAAGYAKTPDGKTLCYPCADDAIRAEMSADPPGSRVPFLLYLNCTAEKVISWTGTTMAIVTSCTKRCVGFSGERWYVRAATPDGAEWYGIGPGPMMYLRLRKCKA